MFKSFYKFANPHIHNHKLVAVNDEYTTKWTDATSSIVTWSMRYYECSCGKRTSEVYNDYRGAYKNSLSHRGVDAAIKNWIDCGVVPTKSYNPADNSYFVKPSVDEKEVDPIVNLNKTVQDLCVMLNVIKRDYDLEKKYPRLKTAADNYNKLFDKYKTFEDMKAGQDEPDK